MTSFESRRFSRASLLYPKRKEMSGAIGSVIFILISYCPMHAPHQPVGDPSDPKRDSERHLAIGMLLFNRGEFDGSLIEFSEAIRLSPALARAFYGRSLAWYHKRDYEKSL